MNSKDTRAALLVAKRATGGIVLGDQRQANLSKFLEGNHPSIPSVLYHGTNRNFPNFHYMSHFGTQNTANDLSYSKSFKSNIMPVHISMKNPLYVGREKGPFGFYQNDGDVMDHVSDVLKKNGDEENSKKLISLSSDFNSWAGDRYSSRDDQNRPTANPKYYKSNSFAKKAAEIIKSAGYDGIVYDNCMEGGFNEDGSLPKSYIALHPNQVKSAIGNNGQFDPTSKDITKATGGAVTDNDNFRSWFGDSVTHTNGTPHVFYTGTSKDKDFNSFNVGRHGSWFTQDPEVASQYADSNDSQGYKQDGWSVVKTNTASRVIPAYIKAEKPYTGELPTEALSDNYKNSQSAWFDKLRAQGYDSWIPASSGGKLAVVLKEPQQIKSLYNSGSFDPKQKHMNKASGGAAEDTSQKIKGSDGVERFGFSFTPRAKRSIMKGQPAFARGGKVEPTDAQKSAGNYKKKHINFQGLPISIENEKGSIRSGQDEKGNKWSVKMPADYGYVKRTEGADGDHVDVYVGPDETSSSVFVIDQKHHTTGKFDEHKVMLGFDSLRSAIQTYSKGFSDGRAHLRLGNVARLSMKEFKQWLSHHDTKKPIRNQSAIDKALSVAKSAQGAKNGI